MNQLKLDYPINLHLSVEGGQLFNWLKVQKDHYIILFSNWAIELQLTDNTLTWQTYPNKNDYDKATNFLNLDITNNLSHYMNLPILNQIIRDTGVIFLFHQDLHQTIISFILSARQNIRSIRNQILRLSERFGNKINIRGIKYNLFPNLENLSESSELLFKNMKFGYRARYLDLTIKSLVSGDYTNYNSLLKLSGVGLKIRDCVAVFSLKMYDKVPIDIWAKRAVVDMFKAEDKKNYKYYQNYYNNLFPLNPAYAAQYIFEYYRNLI